MEAPISVSSSANDASVRKGQKPDTSVEGRLAALEKKCEALQERLGEAHDRITSEASQLDVAVKVEQRECKEDDRKNADLLKELSTGGLSIEWMGLVWLFVGIVCATIPEEISDFLSGF